MARTYEASLENDKLTGFSADELVNMLIEAEWDNRQNRNIERRLRNARFRYQSCMERVDYSLSVTLTVFRYYVLLNAILYENTKT